MREKRGTYVYDTDKAVLVGEKWEGGYQALYRKRTGEFFFYVKCGEPVEGSIEPVLASEAKEWIRKNLCEEKLEECFGAELTLKAEKKRLISLSIDENVYRRMRARAADRGLTYSVYVEGLIRKDLE